MQVTEQFAIPNFVIDVTSDTLFTRWNYKHVFTLTLIPSKIAPFVLDTIAPFVKNYTILTSSDIGSSTVSSGMFHYSIFIISFYLFIIFLFIIYLLLFYSGEKLFQCKKYYIVETISSFQ